MKQQTISEIKLSYDLWKKTQGDSQSVILTSLGRAIEIIDSLDAENQELASQIVYAQGAVAKVRAMQRAKSGKKQMKAFRKLVRDDAKEYAKEHVDDDAKKFYEHHMKGMKQMRRRFLWMLGGLLIVIGALAANIYFKWL